MQSVKSRDADPCGADPDPGVADPDPGGADLDPDPTLEKQNVSGFDLIEYILYYCPIKCNDGIKFISILLRSWQNNINNNSIV